MAGFFESKKGAEGDFKADEEFFVRGFDPKQLRKFMDLGNTLAGVKSSDLAGLVPKEQELATTKGNDQGLVSLEGGQDQLDSLLSLFQKRSQSAASRRAQPGQSQTRLV